jgi:hypothetical protein
MQTITVEAPSATHRLVALFVVAALLAIVVSLSVMQFVGSGSTAHLRPIGSSHSIDVCRLHRPC